MSIPGNVSRLIYDRLIVNVHSNRSHMSGFVMIMQVFFCKMCIPDGFEKLLYLFRRESFHLLEGVNSLQELQSALEDVIFV